MSAKHRERRIDVYGLDLVWKLVQLRTGADIPMPSEIWDSGKHVDRRTANEIINDLLEKLGGE